MKKPLITIMIFSLSLGACKNENFELLDQNEDLKLLNSNSQSLVLSPQITPFFDWENNSSIILPNGTSRILPWYSSAATSLPYFILQDYKRADGWELIYNLCHTPGQLGQNYIILYNKFTGILRTFYYLDDSVTLGSNGMWGISINGNNSLLNNGAYFTNSMNKQVNNPFLVTTNITNLSVAKTINRGWNAFDTEFTYDNNATQPLYFSINSFNKNIQDITLSGDLSLTSEGSIVSSSSTNNWSSLTNAAAKAVGTTAGDYIKSKIANDKNNNNPSLPIKLAASVASAVMTGGVGAIVSAGINLLFGSFIGKQSTVSQTSEKLEFKTNGSISLSGSITSNTATNVTPVSTLLVPGTDKTLVNNFIYPYYNKQLGVWNLSEEPIILVEKKALVSSSGPVNSSGDYYYSRTIHLDQSSIKVLINPEITNDISNYTVSAKLYYYEKFNNNSNWDTSSPGSSNLGKIGALSGNKPLYDDGENIIYENYNTEYFYGPEPAPVDPTQDSEVPYIINNSFPNKYVVKVTVTLYPNSNYNQDPIIISRSYLPKYQILEY